MTVPPTTLGKDFTTMTIRRHPLMAALLITLPLGLATACGDGKGETKKPEQATVSVKAALANKTAASKACTDLLGDGTQIAKDVQWGAVDAKQLTVIGETDPDHSDMISCGIKRAGDNDGVWLHVTSSIDALNAETESGAYYDSGTETHAVVTNQDKGTGIVVSEIPTQSKDALTATLTDVVKRVQP